MLDRYTHRGISTSVDRLGVVLLAYLNVNFGLRGWPLYVPTPTDSISLARCSGWLPLDISLCYVDLLN